MTTAKQLGTDMAFLAAVTDRRARVVKAEAIAELQQLMLRDVPRLVKLAERGLLDRTLIHQHAGHLERAAAVRELHDLVELLGGRQICAHCSELAGRPIDWQCPTLVALDG